MPYFSLNIIKWVKMQCGKMTFSVVSSPGKQINERDAANDTTLTLQQSKTQRAKIFNE